MFDITNYGELFLGNTCLDDMFKEAKNDVKFFRFIYIALSAFENEFGSSLNTNQYNISYRMQEYNVTLREKLEFKCKYSKSIYECLEKSVMVDNFRLIYLPFEDEPDEFIISTRAGLDGKPYQLYTFILCGKKNQDELLKSVLCIIEKYVENTFFRKYNTKIRNILDGYCSLSKLKFRFDIYSLVYEMMDKVFDLSYRDFDNLYDSKDKEATRIIYNYAILADKDNKDYEDALEKYINYVLRLR